MTPAFNHLATNRITRSSPMRCLRKPQHPVPRHLVEESANVRVDNPSDLAPFDPDRQGVQPIVSPSAGPKPVAEPQETPPRISASGGCPPRPFGRSCPPVPPRRAVVSPPSALGMFTRPRWRRPVRPPAAPGRAGRPIGLPAQPRTPSTSCRPRRGPPTSSTPRKLPSARPP